MLVLMLSFSFTCFRQVQIQLCDQFGGCSQVGFIYIKVTSRDFSICTVEQIKSFTSLVP